MSKALYSVDGKSWHDKTPVNWTPDETVSKIVIGTPPQRSGGEAKLISLANPLPADLSKIYPNLTHLYLWQISNLTELPHLPEGLKCLDVRGCEQLKSASGSGNSVETLDFGGCNSLEELPIASATLKRLFLHDCSSLEADVLVSFMRHLTKAGASPIEIDATRILAVKSLKRFPRTLRRLVLTGCRELTDIHGLEEFKQLHHLNLSDCESIRELPAIPDHLRYAQLYGSENLSLFMRQDIGPYDRGTPERPNVSKTLYTRRKFGGKLTASAHAKLLLLGDGRVGKAHLRNRSSGIA